MSSMRHSVHKERPLHLHEPKRTAQLAQVMDSTLIDLVSTGQVQTEVVCQSEKASFRNQANLDMYTSEAMRRRQALKQSPHVVHAVYRWWLFIGGGEFCLRRGFITKKEYIQMCTLTEQVMTGEDFDAEQSVSSASKEWDERIGPEKDQMGWEQFFDEIWEFVDIWTDNSEEVTYCNFLRATLRKVEILRAELAGVAVARSSSKGSVVKEDLAAWLSTLDAHTHSKTKKSVKRRQDPKGVYRPPRLMAHLYETRDAESGGGGDESAAHDDNDDDQWDERLNLHLPPGSDPMSVLSRYIKVCAQFGLNCKPLEGMGIDVELLQSHGFVKEDDSVQAHADQSPASSSHVCRAPEQPSVSPTHNASPPGDADPSRFSRQSPARRASVRIPATASPLRRSSVNPVTLGTAHASPGRKARVNSPYAVPHEHKPRDAGGAGGGGGATYLWRPESSDANPVMERSTAREFPPEWEGAALRGVARARSHTVCRVQESAVPVASAVVHAQVPPAPLQRGGPPGRLRSSSVSVTVRRAPSPQGVPRALLNPAVVPRSEEDGEQRVGGERETCSTARRFSDGPRARERSELEPDDKPFVEAWAPMEEEALKAYMSNRGKRSGVRYSIGDVAPEQLEAEQVAGGCARAGSAAPSAVMVGPRRVSRCSSPGPRAVLAAGNREKFGVSEEKGNDERHITASACARVARSAWVDADSATDPEEAPQSCDKRQAASWQPQEDMAQEEIGDDEDNAAFRRHKHESGTPCHAEYSGGSIVGHVGLSAAESMPDHEKPFGVLSNGLQTPSAECANGERSDDLIVRLRRSSFRSSNAMGLRDQNDSGSPLSPACASPGSKKSGSCEDDRHEKGTRQRRSSFRNAGVLVPEAMADDKPFVHSLNEMRSVSSGGGLEGAAEQPGMRARRRSSRVLNIEDVSPFGSSACDLGDEPTNPAMRPARLSTADSATAQPTSLNVRIGGMKTSDMYMQTHKQSMSPTTRVPDEAHHRATLVAKPPTKSSPSLSVDLPAHGLEAESPTCSHAGSDSDWAKSPNANNFHIGRLQTENTTSDYPSPRSNRDKFVRAMKRGQTMAGVPAVYCVDRAPNLNSLPRALSSFINKNEVVDVCGASLRQPSKSPHAGNNQRMPKTAGAFSRTQVPLPAGAQLWQTSMNQTYPPRTQQPSRTIQHPTSTVYSTSSTTREASPLSDSLLYQSSINQSTAHAVPRQVAPGYGKDMEEESASRHSGHSARADIGALW